MHYLDPVTGTTYPLDTPRWRSQSGHPLGLAPGPGLARDEIETSRRSIWRYAKALLVPSADAVTLGEGWTPLLWRRWRGLEIGFKLDYLMPSGSFKDRGMTVLVSYLKRHGVTDVLEDSSGNAGASLATYAAAAGLRARILVPEHASYAKIAQMAALGADVVQVPGTRQQVADEALRQSGERFYASHNLQPFFIEGTKTLAYELWEQLGFEAPDRVIAPVGYGSNISGCERGFDELLRGASIARLPRLYGVQAERIAPLARAFVAGAEEPLPVEPGTTIAEGIASQRPQRGREVLAAVRRSQGAMLAVSEDEIVAALRSLAGLGLYVEPTSAVAVAGLDRLIDAGVIAPGERTIVVLTGSGLKAAETIGRLLGLDARPPAAPAG